MVPHGTSISAVWSKGPPHVVALYDKQEILFTNSNWYSYNAKFNVIYTSSSYDIIFLLE